VVDARLPREGLFRTNRVRLERHAVKYLVDARRWGACLGFAGRGSSAPVADTPRVLTTRITATAFGPGDASATRFAIVRLGHALYPV
jgi:hypothetical protein